MPDLNRSAPRPPQFLRLENILARTAEMRTINAPPTPEGEAYASLTPRQRKAVEAIDASDFGCQQDNVRTLVGAIMDCTFPPAPAKSDNNFRFIPGGIALDYSNDTFVLIGNTDSDGDATNCMADDGSVRDGYLDSGNSNNRAATDDEVRAFYATFIGE